MGSELLLLGIIGGILGGLLGVGGGTVYVPVLVILFHLSQQTAQGIALTVMIPMALLGSYSYKMRGHINKDIIVQLMLGSVCGAVAGALSASILPGILLRKFFALFLFGSGIKMLWPTK